MMTATTPMGGRTPRPHVDDNDRRYSHLNNRDTEYPLVCVCADPQPEWVYAANQCRRCFRLIEDGTEPWNQAAS